MKLLIIFLAAALFAADPPQPKRPAKLTTEEALRVSIVAEQFQSSRAALATSEGEFKLARQAMALITEEMRRAKGAPAHCFIDRGEWIQITMRGNQEVPIPCELPPPPPEKKEVKK